MQDLEGNKMKAGEYLENALTEMKGMSEAIEQKNKARRQFKQFFQDRDCAFLVRPVEDEKQMQSLNTLENTSLRQEFVS